MRAVDEVFLATPYGKGFTGGYGQPTYGQGAGADSAKWDQVGPYVSGYEPEAGLPRAQKTTDQLNFMGQSVVVTRVPLQELELTYLYNPLIFNGINKIVQTIMSAPHSLICKNKQILEYFNKFLEKLGNSGTLVTWDEILNQIFKYQCIYGRAFVENIYNKPGNRIVDWDLVDPKKMDYAKAGNLRIALDEYGRPYGFTETLPYGYVIGQQILPPEIADKITLLPNSIFLEPRRIAQIKLFTVGDGFYGIGLIEPIYKISLRKLNIEEALANAIWRHGFPIIAASVGDANHEPTPQQVNTILTKLKDINFKQELAYPYYYDLKILESRKAEKLKEHLEYFREQEVAGLGIPKPFATGGGESTNRATLGNQSQLFNLTLRDIIQKTVSSIRQNMFRPICRLEGFDEIPDIKWEIVGPEEVDKKVKRLLEMVKLGIMTPQEAKPKLLKEGNIYGSEWTEDQDEFGGTSVTQPGNPQQPGASPPSYY